MQRLLCLLFGLSLLALSACDNPTSVGQDLIGETGDQIATVRLPAESASQLDSLDLITGSAPSTSQNLRRVLAGEVRDPAFGAVAATGYLGFQASDVGLSDSISVNQISLKLIRRYLYGDSTQALSLQLRNMPDAWAPSGASADTTLEAGAVVQEYDVDPGDSLITLPLPDAWVKKRLTALQNATFGDNFHGFQLAPQSGNAVLGFNPSFSRLQIETNTDTLTLPLDQTLTTLDQSSSVAPPANRLAIQNGVGPQALFEFGFENGQQTNGDANATLPLSGHVPNRAELVLQADTSLSAPAGFVRPRMKALSLYATRSGDDEFVLVRRAFRNEDGRFVLASGDLRSAVQLVLQEKETFTRFRVAPGLTRQLSGEGAVRPVSITPLRLYGPSTSSCPQGGRACAPAFNMTLTLTQ